MQRSLSMLAAARARPGPGPPPGPPHRPAQARDLRYSSVFPNQHCILCPSPPVPTISERVEPAGMRHAIIRRHNSLYSPATRTGPGPGLLAPPYKLHDVSGASEVRPIVTLQRSKTSAASLHYRAGPAVARSYSTAPQFRQYIARYRCSPCWSSEISTVSDDQDGGGAAARLGVALQEGGGGPGRGGGGWGAVLRVPGGQQFRPAQHGGAGQGAGGGRRHAGHGQGTRLQVTTQ